MATKVASRAVTTAMAIAGRASRACDVCAGKSARWYCGADAAYLCDRCDTQVHSANSLSLRHERVRLTPSGVPARKPTTDIHPSPAPRKRSISKILHTPVPQALPSRKRSRTTRPHPHHRRLKPNPEPKQSAPKQGIPKQSIPKQSNVKTEVKAEELTFDDLFDTKDFFFVDDTQEVPSLDITLSHSPSSELDSVSLDSFEAFSPDFHAVSSPASEDSNFAAYFKGKAAHDDDVMSDHFSVPDAAGFENAFDDAGIDPLACDVDGGITLTGEACFIPGDIPDLDGFEDFGSRELGSLSFDLELPDGDAETGMSSSSSISIGISMRPHLQCRCNAEMGLMICVESFAFVQEASPRRAMWWNPRPTDSRTDLLRSISRRDRRWRQPSN